MPRVLVPLADGCEEMEAVIIIDVLRRAGWDVVSVGIKPGPVTASRGVTLMPDTTWDEIEPTSFDLIVLPGGGPGTENLKKDIRVVETIKAFHEKRKIVGAVCAAPLVLQEAQILENRRATCHPGVQEELTQTKWLDDIVVEDENIITSQGPGTSFDFALSIIAKVDGQEKADEIKKGLVLPS